MPRAEISDWKPLDIEDLKNVRCLYPKECLDAIIAHLGEMSAAEHRKTQIRIFDIAVGLHIRLNQSSPPTLAEQIKALESLFDNLNNTLSCWSEFDLRSKERIEDIANNDPQQNTEDQYSGGRERVARSIRAMEDLRKWTKMALEIKEKPIGLKKKGRPEERAALEELYEIWGSSQTRKTTRLFCEFAEAALGPVLRENKKKEALGYLARSVIEERNANTGT
jgi:hypothetical protein